MAAVWGVTAGAIEALAPTLQAGRLLNDADVSGRALVAVVNQEAVKVLWPGVEVSTVPGRFLNTTDGRRQVVGVIADVRSRPGERVRPALTVSAALGRRGSALVRSGDRRAAADTRPGARRDGPPCVT